ncbi:MULTISPECIES: TldD/PmbA family protein [unclassified Oceanispirochaeta]|uniref:TldD/PmbA family protein n=1 Tax=unclassified Oceanispirochaeta TaxID=2635722 RepID=UPI001313EA21|nr:MULTISPECIES: TldD/PmbA family protein [unclassified Oceanispirochaeta]MBF9018267.1 TldD/PmbA family protein [Oceanispirochaeta sp. M2]NPD74732.1 TldD/PmbA family protein [Oceanispirochaeta sp. M1]
MPFTNFIHSGTYNEYRHHEIRNRRIIMVDGSLVSNDNSHRQGFSARVYHKGYWGFASSTRNPSPQDLSNKALANAHALEIFGENKNLLPTGGYQGEHGFSGKPNLSSLEVIELMVSIDAMVRKKYSEISTVSLVTTDEFHDKFVQNSAGSRVYNNISRASLGILMTIKDADDKPVVLGESIFGKGGVGDLDLSMAIVEEKLDDLYQHLLAKREAVPAKGGLQSVVLAPNLAGMLAHEAMGHPCEADLVLGGAVTGDLRGKKIASDLITMVDFAHTYEGQELLMPVYADDEGTQGIDVTLIQDGVLTDFMHNRETAMTFKDIPTGNARAFKPDDEPLIRMRNTAILPGNSELEEMISGVEDGYYLMKTQNGQADTTTEFMFGVNLGYEIKNGKLGRAIKDTTLSGSALKMLQSVDAVSNDMYWINSGYCGKKQPMVVSMGGPAIRAKAQLGGE